ncbi:MAG TPA: hypothetical protein DCP92_14645 [Nitrospiraceae bacterium]|nr:hypothetical protein [Nitrospiraceae bacterium]
MIRVKKYYSTILIAVYVISLQIGAVAWAGAELQSTSDNSAKSRSEIQGTQVEDMIKKWHFKWIGDIYSDGHDKLLCVGTENNQSAYWNPVKDSLSAPLKEKCGASPKLSVLKVGVFQKLPNGLTDLCCTDNSFGNGAKIYLESDGSSAHCGPGNFLFYYTVENKNGSTDSFYIIHRSNIPIIVEEGIYCEDGPQKIEEYFDSPNSLATIDIGNGRTLLFGPASGLRPPWFDNYPILLVLTSIPKSTWASDRNIFIVPRKDLESGLRFEHNLAARYKAVLRAIGEPSARVQ